MNGKQVFRTFFIFLQDTVLADLLKRTLNTFPNGKEEQLEFVA